MKQILIVEDDELLNKMLVYNLQSESYGIVSVETVKEAMEVLKSQPFDLVLLDINLPDGNGYELGAVDYITKPFSIHSLQRKVENVLRMMRHHVSMQDVFDDGRLFLNFAEQTAMLGGKPLTLSTLEFRMLNLFCQNRNRVLTRKQLLEKIWDCTENYVDEHTLTTTLSRIRGKIETNGTVYIKTVYGMGYKWTGGEPA
ncbi:response regulator transcription factor [Blautia wexlerae]|uniref:response regulator transcription factor n=1 Tax=Blautia wexlerae TaxID=418240 RepID=UPI00156D54ED|nr:response regulator transcription factor [Blautia wexlerae]MCB5555350.1 response regulator transcription factor [Blautia wexlerae]NSG01274.1 response regulator transcription factor [Blautia wexlerae]